jgi:hypothetical protein
MTHCKCMESPLLRHYSDKAAGWPTVVRFPEGTLSVKTGCGAHLLSNEWVMGFASWLVKWPSDALYSPPSI